MIAGDTKVVDKGHGDGVSINTSGIGVIPRVTIAPNRAQAGDVVLISGTIGDHGMAVMSEREGLQFESDIVSDTAALNGLVIAAATHDVHVLRRRRGGGRLSALNEIVRASQVGVVLDERTIPVNPSVQSACDMLGMDPLFVANEGKLLAIVPENVAETVLAVMRTHLLGKDGAIIGRITSDHPGILVARTGIGGTRVIRCKSANNCRVSASWFTND